ncbi:MAG: uroporphyrinogen-III C-methyltransferase [Fibrobacteria bacterium]|nr:uroporphyrinogen-III C-methyltransferase [Fibrobacteria bacterium]
MERPPLYPLFLDLASKDVLVVGGGRVGLRKSRELLACGARVRVISPTFDPGFDDLSVTRIPRAWRPGDEGRARLVVAATDDPAVNRAVYANCSQQRILCNVVDVPTLCDFHAAAVAREGSVQIAIGTAGAAPSLASWARRRMQEWLSDGVAGLVDLFERLRGETRTTMEPGERESFWKSLDPDHLLEVFRSRGADACETEIRSLLSGRNETATPPGRVILVGAGPGHPDLITRMGLRALGRATALVHDRLVSKELLQSVPTSCEIHPVGKTGFGKSHRQEDINALLVELARKGHTVVRLKGGDSFVYGRGGEEIEACREAGVDVEVVPGLSSSLTVPAYAGIPITHRGLSRSFAVVSGFHADGTVARIPDAETVVIMMPLHSMKGVRNRFMEAGWKGSTPCAAIHSGTNPDQKVVFSTLDGIDTDLERSRMASPLIVVVGEVAGWAQAHPELAARLHTAPRGGLAG